MKKFLLLIIVLFPILVSAKCDVNKNNEYISTLAPQITYDNHFNSSTKDYTLTVFNIPNGFFAVSNNRRFYPDNEGKIVFNGIRQGANITISIYASNECNAIKYIGKTEDYYNPFYNSEICLGYEDKLTYCAYEFTSSQITKEIIEKAKYNYEHTYSQETKNREEKKELSFIELVKLYISKWWVKVLLSALTTIISIVIYNAKFRKIKHGI